MKERLVSCKELLHYKRDELKKLWLDGVEHKYVLEMLERIERLERLEILKSLERLKRLRSTRNHTLKLK